MPQKIEAKTILNKTRRRDPWFLDDYTINPFSGCSFNCLYCYIRGSRYGEHMEEKLAIKTNAVELLDKQLHIRAKKKQYGIIVLSSATDPYLQFEKDLHLTRNILEVILKYRFPLHVITKSDLVVRDFDLLEQINSEAILPAEFEGRLPAKVFITYSFSTISDSIAKIIEPGATKPSLRLDTLKASIERGFFSGVSLMPLMPYITDTADHLEDMFYSFHKSGAKYVFPATLTLFGNDPSDSKPLMLRAIRTHFPELENKYRKFFSDSNEMPAYYKNAFHKKMEELSNIYQLKNRIA